MCADIFHLRFIKVINKMEMAVPMPMATIKGGNFSILHRNIVQKM